MLHSDKAFQIYVDIQPVCNLFFTFIIFLFKKITPYTSDIFSYVEKVSDIISLYIQVTPVKNS